MEICQLGNPILRQPATPITDPTHEQIQTLIDDLIDTMKQGAGVGIAAPQVGIDQQILIVASHPNLRYPQAPTMEPLPMLNPRIIDHGNETEKGWEGCLSVPGIRGLVPRYSTITVEYLDRQGDLCQKELAGFVARIFQHEYDHLQGKVFVDRVESTQDLMTEQEYQKRVIQQLPVVQD